MNVNQAKFQKKFDSRTISRELPYNNRPQYEALGNKYRVCGVYSPEPRAEAEF